MADKNKTTDKTRETRPGGLVSAGELLARMMPAMSGQVRRFDEMARSWGSVAGPWAVRVSVPYDLKDGTLYVAVHRPVLPQVSQRLAQMKGNIRRLAKEGWNLDIKEIKVTGGPPPARPKLSAPHPVRHGQGRPIEVSDDEVQAVLEKMPDTLPAETAEVLARLRVLLTKKNQISN